MNERDCLRKIWRPKTVRDLEQSHEENQYFRVGLRTKTSQTHLKKKKQLETRKIYIAAKQQSAGSYSSPWGINHRLLTGVLMLKATVSGSPIISWIFHVMVGSPCTVTASWQLSFLSQHWRTLLGFLWSRITFSCLGPPRVRFPNSSRNMTFFYAVWFTEPKRGSPGKRNFAFLFHTWGFHDGLGQICDLSRWCLRKRCFCPHGSM